MSEHHAIIVDIDASVDDAPAQAQRMVDWLQANGIVGEGIRTGELYERWLKEIDAPKPWPEAEGNMIVYPPGENVLRAASTNDPTGLFYNWLEIKIGPTVFHAGEGGIGVFCPSCTKDQVPMGDQWVKAIDDWVAGNAGTLLCVECGFIAPLRLWNFDPVWGFGNLGFQFSNWDPLDRKFVDEFMAHLGNEVRVVSMWV